MDRYLIPLTNLDDVPSDAYVIYSIEPPAKYYILKKYYRDFVHFFIDHNKFNDTRYTSLCLDLTRARSHSLVFDIDFTGNETNIGVVIDKYIRKFLIPNLKLMFFAHIHHFTVIVALREDHCGFHIHIPEIEISSDNYIFFCQKFKEFFDYEHGEDIILKFDIPVNFFLAGCRKPNARSAYFPGIAFFVDDGLNEHELFLMDNDESKLTRLRSQFKSKKCNMSIFKNLLYQTDPDQRFKYCAKYMMPVQSLLNPPYKLCFETRISTDDFISNNEELIATFVSRQAESMYIIKNTQLVFDDSYHLFIYKYFTMNNVIVSDLETDFTSLKIWLAQCQNRTQVDKDGFESINRILKEDNVCLQEDTNPLRSILRYNNEYYFLPNFYALCNYFNKLPNEMVELLIPLIGETDLLTKLSAINPDITKRFSEDLTTDTLKYCGFNLKPKPKSTTEKVNMIIRDMMYFIGSCTDKLEMKNCILHIIERHFPLKLSMLSIQTKRGTKMMWNNIQDGWIDVTSTEITELLEVLLFAIKGTIEKLSSRSEKFLVTAKVLSCISKSQLLSSINLNLNIFRTEVYMDRFKWLVRLADHSVYDILTQHVGGCVPEYYLSSKNLGVPYKRNQMIHIAQSEVTLKRLYSLLTSKHFFRQNLKNLLLDVTDNFYDTLCHTLVENNYFPDCFNPHEKSMLEFYLHLCKWTSFDYDTLMCLLDFLASIFISTNYERKIYILRGETTNGKSKLFQFIQKVFGSYCFSIMSNHLQQRSGINASPEYGPFLNTKIVTVEELPSKMNESLVKEMTGANSIVYRNLYEGCQTGIPTAKIIAATNNLPSCITTDAFKQRVLIVPFQAKFVSKPPPTTEKQVTSNTFQLLPGDFTETSYEGFFLLAFYHLQANIDIRGDGLLHYREPSAYIKEYTENYLALTDIYQKFKKTMDVQKQLGQSVTYNDVKSAIRSFINSMKDCTIDEMDLIVNFDEEFESCKKTTIVMPDDTDQAIVDDSMDGLNTYEVLNDNFLSESGGSRKRKISFENNEPSTSKKIKMDEIISKSLMLEDQSKNTVIIYENVFIKNLKRVKSF